MLRAQRGLTQADLAGQDFSKAFISHIEHGRTRVSLRAAAIIAARLGVDIAELLAPSERSGLQIELSLAVAESHLARHDPTAALAAVRSQPPGLPAASCARLRRLEGRALLALGQPREAIAPLSEAVHLFRSVRQPEGTVRATFDLAYTHASLDEPGAAVALLGECQGALTGGVIIDRTLELQVYSLLAGIFTRMGDLASADLHAERAARLAEDVVDDAALDTLYASLVGLRREQGDLESALTYARKALHLHERAGRESEAIHAWNNLAWIYIERGQHGRAEDALQKAERLRRERHGSLGHLLVTRAKLELARGDAPAALTLCAQALADENLRQTSRAQALFIAARAKSASGVELCEIRSAFDAALHAYEAEPPRKRARVLESYAESLFAAGRTEEAYQQARLALALQRASR
jgi:tetratricopeptide (TPR) repeat protein